MIINKEHPKFKEYFARYLRSKEGSAFAISLAHQLVDVIHVNKAGHVTQVEVDITNGIEIVVDE